MNGDPDFITLTKQVGDLGVRLTRLEALRRTDQADRKNSQDRIERELKSITNTDNPESLASQVRGINDLVQQLTGIAKLLRWIGASGTFTAIAALIWVAVHSHP